jgi:hypothetical protein
MSGPSRIGFEDFGAALNVPDSSGWRAVAVVDFNQDSSPDILWHNGATGASQIWYMNRAARIGFDNLDAGLNVPDSSGWQVVSANDLNSDGKADILWHNGTTGATQVWYMNGANRIGFANFDASLNVPDSTGWRFATSEDFNADGRPDILAHHGPTGASQTWFLSGTTRTGFADFDPALSVPDSSGWGIVNH